MDLFGISLTEILINFSYTLEKILILHHNCKVMRLRPYIFFPLTLFIIISLFYSCGTAFDVGGSSNYSEYISPSVPNWNGNAVTWNDNTSSGNQIFKLEPTTKTVQLARSAHVRMTKLNVSGTAVPTIQTQYVTSASNRNASTPNDEEFDVKYEGRIDYAPARDFIPPTEKEISALLAKNASMRSAYIPGDNEPNRNSSPPTGFIVNESTKDLYLDNSTQHKKATLRAKGNNCLVWVVNDYYNASGNSGAKVNSATAKTLADDFDMIYQLVRAVFGEESETILGAGPIGTASDTGSMVNIVIYDIDGDYVEGKTHGTYGFFWSKDYYPKSVYNFSNVGKYFYVDSYFSHHSNTTRKEIYSTLVHEFQHMINFNQKFIKKGIHSPTWYNEMLSMMAEDMIQQKLGITDNLVLKGRLPSFCSGYYESGITDWLGGNGVYYSYAVNAVFGAYLARAYGGAKLAYEMLHNDYVGFPSIIQAIKASTSKTVTEEELLKDFANNIVSPSTSCALNKDLPESKPNSSYNDNYTFPLKALNIHSYVWTGGTGPKLFSGNQQVAIRPYGIVLHDIGTVSNISFSSPVNSNAKVYLFTKN